MSEEIMSILKMVEDGKISSEDAARLINAVKGVSQPIPEKNVSDDTNIGDVANIIVDFVKDTTPKIVEGTAKVLKKTGETMQDLVGSVVKHIDDVKDDKELKRTADEVKKAAQEVTKNAVDTVKGFVDEVKNQTQEEESETVFEEANNFEETVEKEPDELRPENENNSEEQKTEA